MYTDWLVLRQKGTVGTLPYYVHKYISSVTATYSDHEIRMTVTETHLEVGDRTCICQLVT